MKLIFNFDPCRTSNIVFGATFKYVFVLVCERRLELSLFFNFHIMNNKNNLIRQTSPHIIFGIVSTGSQGSFCCEYPLAATQFPDSIQITRTKNDLNIDLSWIDKEGKLHGRYYYKLGLDELANVALAIRKWARPLVQFQGKPSEQQPDIVGWCHFFDEEANKWVHQQYGTFDDAIEALWHCLMMLKTEGKKRLEDHPFWREIGNEN